MDNVPQTHFHPFLTIYFARIMTWVAESMISHTLVPMVQSLIPGYSKIQSNVSKVNELMSMRLSDDCGKTGESVLPYSHLKLKMY